MIPTRDQLEAISKAREGSLAQTPFPALLCALALHERSLVLEVHKGPLVKKVVMEYGVPVDCRSNLVHETLSRFVASSGKVGEEQAEELWREATGRGVPLGEHLVAKGLLTAQDLFRLLQQNLAKKLLDIFSWREGEFRTSFDLPRVDSPLKVNVPQLIVTGIAKFARKEEADTAVGKLIGQRLAIHPTPPFPLDDLRLSQVQKRLVDALQKARRIDELALETGVDFDEITRFLYALALLGIAIPVDQVPAAKTAQTIPPAAPPPAPAPPPPPGVPERTPAEPAALERLRNEVMQAFLVHRRQDPFDLLGVSESASLPQIREAFLAFCRRFAPWSFEGAELDAVRDKARDLFLAGSEAYAKLSDYDGRNEILSRRRAARETSARKPVPDAFAIKTDLLDPAVQYRKGLQLKASGDTQGARRHFEFAADCDPQNGVYRAEAAHCLYLYAPLSAKQAMRELDETLRVDPRCGLAALFGGEILRASGSRAAAQEWYRRAAQLMQGDPRPLTALKSLGGKA